MPIVTSTAASISTPIEAPCEEPTLAPIESFARSVSDLVSSLDPNDNAVHLKLVGGADVYGFATGIVHGSADGAPRLEINRFHAYEMCSIRLITHKNIVIENLAAQ